MAGWTVVAACGGDSGGGEIVEPEPSVPTSITVAPATVTLTALGDTARLTARVLDQRGQAMEGVAVTWSSGDESVVTVSSAGLATAAGNGTTVVTASAGGATGQASAVVEQRVASVAVTPGSLWFGAVGDTARLEAEVADANGATIDGATVAWASGDESVVTVNSTGLVTAVGNGAAVVTASAGGQQGSASVAVRTVPESDRAALVALYNATNGDSWASSANWLTDVPLDEWYGVRLDAGGRVEQLKLDFNGLTGTLPAELGELSNLQVLDLSYNDLTGTIPLEVADLTNLRTLWLAANELAGTIPPELGNLRYLLSLALWGNELTGAIPPQLGDLSALRELSLWSNDLTGPIPPELGSLSHLRWLSLGLNGLSGTIPEELGELPNLMQLWLQSNELTGPVPLSLGNLSHLRTLRLHTNELTGPVPPELGELSELEELFLFDNELTGAIPGTLGNLSNLETLWLSGNGLSGTMPDEMTAAASLEELFVDTEICVPRTPAFEAWLNGIDNYNLFYCYDAPAADSTSAYVTQAVPTSTFEVPLVAGNTALLRVFVTANNPDSVGMPPVRATFYSGGAEVHTAEVPAQTGTPIPASVDEGSFAKSANVEIPGSVLTPGLEMVVEIDPDGTLGSSVDLVRRIPETGRTSLNVRTVDVFELTVIPFLWEEKPDSTLLDLVSGLGPEHELLYETRTLLPISEMDVALHDPVWSSSNSAFELLRMVQTIRVAEGGTGHWMGLLPNPTGAGGVAYVPGQDSFSGPWSGVIAHELGHNLSLFHAPCGGAGGPDPAYPHADGAIGVWGWEAGTTRLIDPSTPDLMGYCEIGWISDYSFARALNHRYIRASLAARLGSPRQTLLLWGGKEADGSVFLNPAFVIDAPPSLPAAGGEYQLVGEAEDGSVLFSLEFGMDEVADGDGGSGFAFALPVEPSWAGDLARILLMGGDADAPAVLGRDGKEAGVLLRDPATGRVLGLLLGVPADSEAQADLAATWAARNVDAQVSRGVPGGGAWR